MYQWKKYQGKNMVMQTVASVVFLTCMLTNIPRNPHHLISTVLDCVIYLSGEESWWNDRTVRKCRDWYSHKICHTDTLTYCLSVVWKRRLLTAAIQHALRHLGKCVLKFVFRDTFVIICAWHLPIWSKFQLLMTAQQCGCLLFLLFYFIFLCIFPSAFAAGGPPELHPCQSCGRKFYQESLVSNCHWHPSSWEQWTAFWQPQILSYTSNKNMECLWFHTSGDR